MTTVSTGKNRIYWVRDNIIAEDFPDIDSALDDPDGLLAIGGDLEPERLLQAYRRGIFPWYSEGQPIMWWSPNPRWIIYPESVNISRSLQKTMRKNIFKVTFDKAFTKVIKACAEPREKQAGTWITFDIIKNYEKLHADGFAHSVECWQGNRLAGGLYGICIGRIFFGESMFSHIPDASKVALVHLSNLCQKWQFPLIDCQIYSPHLESMGATPISRQKFREILSIHCNINERLDWPDITGP